MTTPTLARAAGFGRRCSADRLRPRTPIDAAAVRNLLGGAALAAQSRMPETMGGAAAAIFAKGRDFTGRRRRDDPAPAAEGATGFERLRRRRAESRKTVSPRRRAPLAGGREGRRGLARPGPAARSGPGAERRRGVIREGEA